ncbi:MAG: hypothetical protein ACRYF3_05115, partial [Janthinobacterium lividum]
HYRHHFEPSQRWPRPHAILAVAAIVSETQQRADLLVRAQELSTARLRQGRPAPLPSPEEAAAHHWTLTERNLAAQSRGHLLAGTPEVVVARLRSLVESTLADEVIVVTQIHDPAERRESYALLANAWGLTPPRLAERTVVARGDVSQVTAPR